MIDIMDAAVDFYAMQAIEACAVTKANSFLPSHERFIEDFRSYYVVYTEKLANALFDYLALITFGEARHSWSKCTHAIEGLPHGGSRGASYEKAVKYNPWKYLPKLSKLFHNYQWDSSYGGESWGRIADAALMYKKSPDVVFIDHCVDLSHNSGLCFDKEAARVFNSDSPDEYRYMLGYKREKAPEAFIYRYACLVSPITHRLIERAIVLGFFDLSVETLRYANKHSSAPALLGYKPIEWGHEELGEIIRVGNLCELCGEYIAEYEVQGKKVCEACYGNLNYCDVCEQKVLGNVAWVDDYGWVCDDCLEDIDIGKEDELDEEKEEENHYESGKYYYTPVKNRRAS